MRLLLTGLLLVLLNIGFAQNSINKEGWELTFNDEFNDQKIDYIKWQDHTYSGTRFIEGQYTYYGQNQFEFTDSTLLIKAEKKENEKNLPYSSGMLSGNKSLVQQYGYFEIRCKTPYSTGFWPAFWLVSGDDWPPEIDVFEFYTNHQNRMSTSLHWKRGEKKKRKTKGFEVEDASKGFHVYAVEWTPKKIIWYYDNEKIRTIRRGVKYLTYKMFMIINLEVSSIKGMNLDKAIFPNYFEIDYVRAYQKNE